MDIVEIRPEHYEKWYILWQGYLKFYKTNLDNEITNDVFRRICAPDVKNMGGFIAFDGDDAIGIVHYIIHGNTWSKKDVCYLEDLFTAENTRGKGVGRALIERIAEFSRENNHRHVYWQTHIDNKTAQTLYNKVATNEGFIVYKKDI